jgi:hypothetical protein
MARRNFIPTEKIFNRYFVDVSPLHMKYSIVIHKDIDVVMADSSNTCI